MGAPELPNDPGDDDLRTAHINHHPPAPSDDSDNEQLPEENFFDGYEPLAMEDVDFGHFQSEIENDNNNSGYNREGSDRLLENRENGEYETVEVENDNPNMPKIETVDAEIEREIWNQPRPLELQIELDGNKTQQILTAMASFQLPNFAVPDWAAGVPEEHWKEELLQRIRQRTPLDDKPKMEVDKE